MNMTKREVIETLCKLTSRVNETVYKWQTTTGCFCTDDIRHNNHFQFDSTVLDFIIFAVNEKIENLNKDLTNRKL